MKPTVTYETSHPKNAEGFTCFRIKHPFICTTNQEVFIGDEYQYKKGPLVAKVRVNNITFQNMTMKMSLYFIDEDKCAHVYQSLEEHGDQEGWSLHDKDRYNLKAFAILRKNLASDPMFNDKSVNTLLEFEF
jgi:hypothetical protein